MHTWLEYHIGL